MATTADGATNVHGATDVHDAATTNDATTVEATRGAGAADVRKGADGVSGMADEVRDIGVYHGFGGGYGGVLVVQPAVVLYAVGCSVYIGFLFLWKQFGEADFCFKDT